MNRLKRFLFQTLMWLVVWLVAWFFAEADFHFLVRNVPVYVFQILVTAVLIFGTAPKLLFQKKYVLFVVVSVIVLVLASFVISWLYPYLLPFPSNRMPLEMPHGLSMGRKPAPQFLPQFVLLSLSYILATFVETFLLAQKKDEETIRNKNENLQTELKLLKSQINPHFLFNALNNIYALSVIDSGKTQQSIAYLSNMLRYVLYECDQELVSLEKEISYIENYIKLFALKSSKTYPITTHFEISDKNLVVAPMLFIPFMENALKHSNIEKIAGTFIRINIKADTKKIEFSIENSKPDTPTVTDELGGIGIENVKKRLSIVYPNQHDLFITETADVFKVNLNIDLNAKT